MTKSKPSKERVKGLICTCGSTSVVCATYQYKLEKRRKYFKEIYNKDIVGYNPPIDN